MSIHEECGVFGVYSPKQENVASLVYYGLYALQHRSQRSYAFLSISTLPVPIPKLRGSASTMPG